jgi:hypothetical protein
MEFLFFYAVVLAVACGLFSTAIADSKGRTGWWFLAGLAFGPIGMLAAGLMETASTERRERDEKEQLQQAIEELKRQKQR